MYLIPIFTAVLACLLGLLYRRSLRPRHPRPPLPVELQLRILDFAAADLVSPKHARARAQLLRSFSLVSRGVTKDAQQHLWHTLAVTSLPRLWGVLRLLEERPAARSHVRVLDVCLADKSKAGYGVERLTALSPSVHTISLCGVVGFSLAHLARWPNLTRLHLRRCRATDNHRPATATLSLPSLTHLTFFQSNITMDGIIDYSPSLVVLATDETTSLGPAVAARLVAFATPDFSAVFPFPMLPSCRVVLLAPRTLGVDGPEGIWHLNCCPNLQTVITYTPGPASAADVKRCLPALATVHEAQGPLSALGAPVAGRVWRAIGVKWEAFYDWSTWHTSVLSQRGVDQFLMMADRVIAEEAGA